MENADTVHNPVASKKFIIIAVAVGAVLLAIILVFALKSDSPSTAAVEFLQSQMDYDDIQFEVVKESIDGDVAEVDINFTIGSLKKGPIIVLCMKFNGQWKAVSWY